MTPEEKTTQMEERNKAICDYYQAGHKLSECARKFQLNRNKILYILKQAGVWQPYVKSKRTKFVGVHVSQETKAALQTKAEEAGVSVSKYASDKLDDVVRAE